MDKLKSKFVSSVSHELRAPIFAVKSAISRLLNKASGPLNNDQEDCIRIAENNLKRLGILIDDILDLSKLEAKKIELHRVSTPISKLINEVCGTFDAWAKTKEIEGVQNGMKAQIARLWVFFALIFSTVIATAAIAARVSAQLEQVLP